MNLSSCNQVLQNLQEVMFKRIAVEHRTKHWHCASKCDATPVWASSSQASRSAEPCWTATLGSIGHVESPNAQDGTQKRSVASRPVNPYAAGKHLIESLPNRARR
ncbi:hypothetical protein WJX84_009361 [Apatococcus fuscideae]|uniref:Uncharacterized protein n=1 Tax=Apatococcus fuscideae TaxID=2026836 RepID=A0AAW1T6F7_9CHLO